MLDLAALGSGAWRQLLVWSCLHPRASWLAAVLLGMACVSPWTLWELQAWWDVQEVLDQQAAQQRDLEQLQKSNAQQRGHMAATPALKASADGVSRLSEGAREQRLQLSAVSLGKPVHVLRTDHGELQHIPVSFVLQGAWTDWLVWVLRWPDVLPSTSLSRLDLKVHPDGTVAAHLSLALPQHLSSAWATSTPTDVAPHLSFAPWIAKELNRPRQPLEGFAREHLRYIGHVAQAGRMLAVVRVVEPGQTAQTQVHTVAVGAYLGQDFGRVEAMDAQELRVRELVRDASGTWQTRSVSLPFMETLP